MDPRPIGVFDSGVGGLTVLHELPRARCPTRTSSTSATPRRRASRTAPSRAATIRRFAHEVAQHLIARDVKLLVVACNSATAAALPDLQREFDGAPDRRDHARGARRRRRPPATRRVGVMATEATVAQRPLPGGDRRCSTPASR